MYFNVHEDRGDRIVGYLVPDSPSAHGRIRVTAEGRPLAVVDSSVSMPGLEGLITLGRRDDISCWFVIDETVVPGLRGMPSVELFEADTGLLVYRRAPAGYTAEKLLRLETHMVPLRHVDQAIKNRFCYAYLRAERWGLETVTQLFHLLRADSLYVSGRVQYRCSTRIADHFKVICTIHEPFEELAERLLLLRHATRRPVLDLRDQHIYAPATEFAGELDWDSDRALKSSFRRMPTLVAQTLQNPLTRQLTADSAVGLLSGNATASALSVLASCDIVALRNEAEHFALALSARLGSDTKIVPTPPRCAKAIELAERLREVSLAHELVAMDLEVYQHVVDAYFRAGDQIAGAPVARRNATDKQFAGRGQR